MKYLKLIAGVILVSLSLNSIVKAQKFAIPFEGYSKKKTTYLFTEEGTQIDGKLSGFRISKGLVETIVLKDSDGKKTKVSAANLSHMYLPPSSLAKFQASYSKITDVNMMDSEKNYDTTLLNDGYVYFEKTSTKVKKETKDLMLQLLNTTFSSEIKVYHDPYARESMGIGVGSFTVAGGGDESYYVKKKGEESAFKLTKKNYKENFQRLFGDNQEFMKNHQEGIWWSDFAKHLYEYSQQ